MTRRKTVTINIEGDSDVRFRSGHASCGGIKNGIEIERRQMDGHFLGGVMSRKDVKRLKEFLEYCLTEKL